jgi:hypothetical protein
MREQDEAADWVIAVVGDRQGDVVRVSSGRPRR